MDCFSQGARLKARLQDAYGTPAERLWAKFPDYAVFRHPMSGKWYAALLSVPQNRLGLEGDRTADILDVKCSPLMIGTLLPEPGFFPAYHMNKSTWISILLDGPVPDDTILSLLSLSYDSVSPKRRK